MSYFKEVWAETFPDSHTSISSKRDQRKKIAKMQRELQEQEDSMTPEEREAAEAQIPEWKRGALVAQEAVEQEKKKGVFGRFSDGVKNKISDTEAAK